MNNCIGYKNAELYFMFTAFQTIYTFITVTMFVAMLFIKDHPRCIDLLKPFQKCSGDSLTDAGNYIYLAVSWFIFMIMLLILSMLSTLIYIQLINIMNGETMDERLNKINREKEFMADRKCNYHQQVTV